MPKISAILTSYNCAAYLGQADRKRWPFAIKVSVEQSEEQVMRGNLSHLLRIDGQIGAETC